jgi:uncharacterized protein (TIGR03067 family)
MRPLVTLLVLALPLSAAPVPKAVKKSPSLDGVWLMTELHSNGTVGQHAARTTRWTIDGETLNYETRGGDGEAFTGPSDATMKLVRAKDAGANAYDYHVNYHTGRKAVYPGVAEIDGDVLRFCYSVATPGVRPAECKCVNETTMFVFKRAEPK